MAGFIFFMNATDVATYYLPHGTLYFYNVSFLLKFGTSANNNTIVDSSTNNVTITNTGTPTQGTFSPYYTNWSNYFNSSSDLRTNTTGINSLSGDYTVEAWVNLQSVPTGTSSAASHCIISAALTTSVYHAFLIGATGYVAMTPDGSGYFDIPGTIPTIGQWSHVAFVKSGSTLTVYLNGTNVGSHAVGAGVWSTTPTVTYIGSNAGNSGAFNGYISNLRLVGSTVYTSNFTPATTPLIAVAGTVLLTCQSNHFIDNSSNNAPITTSGTPRISAFNPFIPSAEYSTTTNGGSVHLDGSDYLTGNSITIAGDFTVEGWFYNNNTPSGNTVWGVGSDSTGIVLRFLSGNAYFYYSGTSTIFNVPILTPYVWEHIAVTRQSGTLTLWRNGVNVSSSPSHAGSFTGTVGIGKSVSGTSFSPFVGYISDFRIVNGTAVYTTNFTPSTAPLTAITNTTLLLHGTNAGVYDVTGKNDIRLSGAAQMSSSVFKFSKSLSLQATGYAIATSSTPYFNNQDFTVEGWVNRNTSSAGHIFGNFQWRTGYQGGWRLAANANGSFYFSGITSSALLTAPINSLPANTWVHVAVSRSGNVFRLFVDGTQVATTTNSSAIAACLFWPDRISIGAYITDGGAFGEQFLGYVEDIRVTNGLARYTANFTPPTSAFPSF